MRNDVVTQNMIKMEKNFIGVNEKGYSRYPYEDYPLFNNDDPETSLIGFVNREMEELNEAITKVEDIAMSQISNNSFTNASELFNRDCSKERTELIKAIIEARKEIADVSNTLNFLDEALLEGLMELK